MASADLTHHVLSVDGDGERSYVEETIKGLIQPMGTNVNGLPVGNIAKYAHTLFTVDVVDEGDRLEDPMERLCEVLHVQEYWVLDNFSHRMCELLQMEEVTYQPLTLGSADSITGWYATSYGSENIYMNISASGVTPVYTRMSYYGRYDYVGVTSALVYEGDKITDQNNVTYKILFVTDYPSERIDKFHYKICAMVRQDFDEQPTSSGTWHLDDAGATTDPRSRHKIYLDTYITPGHIRNDEDNLDARHITCFDTPPYPLTKVFLTKDQDLVFSIGKSSVEQLTAYNKQPYAFIESVPITLYAVNKTEVFTSDITATRVIEQAEQEIREILADHPLGSIRSIETVTNEPVNLGPAILFSTTVTIRYKRVNDEYTPTDVTTYGTAFAYDCDRVTGGIEGVWAETEDGTTGAFDVTTSRGHLYLNVTVCAGNEVYYVSNGTNLGLASTIYTKIMWRFKTSDTSIKAKIIIEFNDASTQEVLADTSSTTWQVGSATITPGKSIDHIRFHADHATGQVYYDWVMLFKAFFYLPNVVNVSFEPSSRNISLPVPGRVTSEPQNLGADSTTVVLTCDTDVEPTAYSWLRSGDTDNADVFLDILHNQSTDGPWQYLVFGNKELRVVIDHLTLDSLSGMLRLELHEYSDSDKSGETIGERFGY